MLLTLRVGHGIRTRDFDLGKFDVDWKQRTSVSTSFIRINGDAGKIELCPSPNS